MFICLARYHSFPDSHKVQPGSLQHVLSDTSHHSNGISLHRIRLFQNIDISSANEISPNLSPAHSRLLHRLSPLRIIQRTPCCQISKTCIHHLIRCIRFFRYLRQLLHSHIPFSFLAFHFLLS